MADTATALSFETTTFDVVTRDNQPWLRVQQIAVALGYSRPDVLQQLYASNAAEFSDSMTALVKLPTAGGEQLVRCFSLRGAHLLGMFARTDKAADFRRWVLDILDSHTAQLPQSATDTITPSEQQNLQELVDVKCRGAADQGKARAEIWSRLHHKFRVAKYSQLPRTQLTEAQLYIMGMQLRSQPEAPQPAAREQIGTRDQHAIARVVWLIADQFKHSSSWSQGVWFYLRHALNNPAPNPWYVDQLTDMAVILRNLYAQAHAVHELTRAIEAEACKRILRKGNVPERVLADLHAKACDHFSGRTKQLASLPAWLSGDFEAIANRNVTVHRMDGHLEKPGYFTALAA